MLVLTVKPGESFIVGSDIKIEIGPKNKVYITAPRNVPVIRSSVLERARNGEEKARNKAQDPEGSKAQGKEVLKSSRTPNASTTRENRQRFA